MEERKYKKDCSECGIEFLTNNPGFKTCGSEQCVEADFD